MSKLTLPPQRNKATTEAEIDAIINKGGQPAPTPASQAVEGDPNAILHINTRLTRSMVDQIDELRAKRPRKIGSPKMGVSLRDWIVEAVIEKLEREKK